MKTPLLTFAAASLAASLATGLCAQGLATATGYADFANAGNGNVQGVPAGTSIPLTGLAIRAADRGGSATSPSVATASTVVGFAPATVTNGVTVTVSESGSAASRGGRAAAGTSADPRRGGPGAHGLAWRLPGRQGATATVVVTWRGKASANARTGVAVDVDGDGTPDFAHRVSNGANQQAARFKVTAGLRGFAIGITTTGLATAGASSEAYDAGVAVTFRPDNSGGGVTCNFRPFGPECGGKLTGTAAPVSAAGGIAVGLRLSGAAPNAVAILAAGSPLPSPVQLPGSRCSLLVNPRVISQTRTDGNGDAGWRFAFRPTTGVSLSTAFQAVTVELSGGGVRLASSNGLVMTCQ